MALMSWRETFKTWMFSEEKIVFLFLKKKCLLNFTILSNKSVSIIFGKHFWCCTKLRLIALHSWLIAILNIMCTVLHTMGSFPTLPLRFEEQCEIRGLLLAGWKDQRGLHCITLCIAADQKIHVVCGQMPWKHTINHFEHPCTSTPLPTVLVSRV